MRSGNSRGGRSALAPIAALLLAPLLILGLGAGSHDAPESGPDRGEPWTPRDDLIRDFVFRTQNVGNLAMAVTNHGFLGNNFAERASSMEYPKGSEIDHMIRGGFWVGGINTSGDVIVTTGVQDGYWGTYTRPTEWVPEGLEPADAGLGWIRERSTLPTSPYYSPLSAISEQDFVARFEDVLDRAHTPEQGNSDDYHTATGLLVDQESYAWSYEPADAMILFKWTFAATRTLQDAYLGMYAEMTSGSKAKYPIGTWPPASANWFYHHQLYWVDDMPEYADLAEEPFNLMVEHHYTYDEGRAPQHGGIKFLGAKFKSAGTDEWVESADQVGWRWWNWEPGSLTLDNDTEKYDALRRPGADDWREVTPSPDSSGDSPVCLTTIGPWNFFPEDSLEVSFAFVAGDDFEDIVQNALYAQTVYRFNFTVPTPPHSPRTRVSTDEGRIRILWGSSPESSVDAVTHDYDFEGYRIYVGHSEEEASFDLLAQFDLDEIPAKNPILAAYFTQEWLDLEMLNHPADPGYADEQAVLDTNFGPGFYRYDGEAVPPFLVTQQDSVGYNTGLGAVLLPESEWVTEIEEDEPIVYKYGYEIGSVLDGHSYWVSVTSYDMGNPETPSLESGAGQTVRHVIPGRSPASAAGKGVTVFPNPYRGSAVWDSNRATGRYVWFAGLPRRAEIKVFTLAGDLVATIDFDRETYNGAGAAGIFRGGEGAEPPLLSGTMAAWDLRSHNGQPVASGLYLFSVTDRDGGGSEQGKFLILK